MFSLVSKSFLAGVYRKYVVFRLHRSLSPQGSIFYSQTFTLVNLCGRPFRFVCGDADKRPLSEGPLSTGNLFVVVVVVNKMMHELTGQNVICSR